MKSLLFDNCLFFRSHAIAVFLDVLQVPCPPECLSHTNRPSQAIISMSFLTLLQDRIMVSLTSLLVLATFFTQTSQSIPKTSYLKLIDVWFVALIFGDFCIILSLVYVETLRLKETQAGNSIKVTPYVINSSKRPSSYTFKSKAARCNKMFIKLFTGAIIVMLLCFVPTCMQAILAP